MNMKCDKCGELVTPSDEQKLNALVCGCDSERFNIPFRVSKAYPSEWSRYG